MSEISLINGYVTRVDDADAEWIGKHRWIGVQGERGGVYAYSTTKIGGKQVKLHRLLLGAPANSWVDHIDGDTLNNQRSNLRFATPSQNSANRHRYHAISGFKGVEFRGIRDRKRPDRTRPWRARIEVDGKRIHLGNFADPAEAARAYDRAAVAHWGEFAATNASLGKLPT